MKNDISLFLQYENQSLCFGSRKQDLSKYVANYRGPIYVYDLQFIRQRYSEMSSALGATKIYYAMKANSHPKILEILKKCGAGADVVSLGEIRRALEAGFVAGDIVFSGVGKTMLEIEEALKIGIHQINVESLPELRRIASIAARMKVQARVVLRLNPNIDIKTHPYIATGLHENKFGMEITLLPELEKIFDSHSQNLELVGISLHLGSQMMEFSGFRQALKILKPVFKQLQEKYSSVCRFDIGGGLGIIYEEMQLAKESELLSQYSQVVREELGDLQAELQSEPGRWLVAHAGVLLTQVQYVKDSTLKTFVILDSGMNHLIRPALYQSYHAIYPLQQRPMAGAKRKCDIVGPICESADFLAKDRNLGDVQAEDFLVIADAGAYGFSMANTYNLQDLPQEICF